MPRFGGTLVEQDQVQGGRFGGTLVEQPEEEKGFTERVGERLEERQQAGRETGGAYARDDITGPEAALQVGGASAGLALDVMGEGLVSAGRGIKGVTPEPVKEFTSSGFETLVNAIPFKDELAEAIKGGAESYSEWAKENPRFAKNVESVFNIGLLFAPAKVKMEAGPTPIGNMARSLDIKAKRQVLKKRKDFVDDLISPKKTEKVLVAETARTPEVGRGPLKRSVVELSKTEKKIAEEVNKIKDVTPKKSIQGNLNAVYKENDRLAKQLEADVGKRRILIGGVDRKIDDNITKFIAENPTIVGNAQTTATRVADKAKQIIAQNDGTAAGLLKARKELDTWIRRQKGDKAFDPTMENALSMSVRNVRNTMNDMLDANIASTRVKRQLKKQSLLYDAIENLGPKAAAESNYAIGRLLQNVSKVLPWRRSFQTDVGALMGLGVIGSSEVLAPVFAGGLAAASVGIGAKRAVMSATTKKALAKLVKATDRAILSSKNPSMIKQLRADRALAVELLQKSETSDEE